MIEFLSCLLGLIFCLSVFFVYVDYSRMFKHLDKRLTVVEDEFNVYANEVDMLIDEVRQHDN